MKCICMVPANDGATTILVPAQGELKGLQRSKPSIIFDIRLMVETTTNIVLLVIEALS